MTDMPQGGDLGSMGVGGSPPGGAKYAPGTAPTMPESVQKGKIMENVDKDVAAMLQSLNKSIKEEVSMTADKDIINWMHRLGITEAAKDSISPLNEISGNMMGRYTDAARADIDRRLEDPKITPDERKKIDKRRDTVGNTVNKRFTKASTGYASPKLSAEDLLDLVITTFGHEHYHTLDDAMSEYIFRDDPERNSHGPERLQMINDALREIGAEFRVNKITGAGDVNGWNKDFYHIVSLTGNLAGSLSPEDRKKERDDTRRKSADSTRNELDKIQASKNKNGPPPIRPPAERE